MRPVERGDAPQVFDDYTDAKPFLVERLGLYCSYCERPIKTLLAVEHVLPKSLHPELREEWSNFLLGCTNCNSAKGNKPVDRDNVLLPDQDNTFWAIHYDQFGRVFPSLALTDAQRTQAEAILALTGLDRFPDQIEDEEESAAALERWQQRSQTWAKAISALEVLTHNDSVQVRQLVVNLAVAEGFFSVWMTIFADDGDMCRRFIQAFPGTAMTCFDDAGQPVNRLGGHI